MLRPWSNVRSLLGLLCVAMASSGCVGVPKSCRALSPADLVGYGDSNGADNSDVTQRLQRLQCLSDRGDVRAAVALGRIYELGDGLPRDERRAARLYQEAVVAVPKTTAIYSPPVRLGGRGQMLFLPNVNAGPGSAAAQFYLGQMYLEGRGVEQNLEHGKNLIGRAAAQGFPGAAKLLERLSQ